MRVLVACEFSGVVREAFRKRGHDAWSCDLLDGIGDVDHHIKDDVINVVRYGWDLMIAHPPCTYLCSSGLHWNKRDPSRREKTAQALAFVRFLMHAPIDKICVENPVGCIGTAIRPADQYIQPYQFGHDASKKTGLWLKNLPPLEIDPKQFVKGRIVGEDKRGYTIMRWANQTDSGQNKLTPSDHRWKDRSITYQGIADAFAKQWG